MKRKHNFRTIMTIIVTATITFAITLLWVYAGTGNIKSSNTILGDAFKSDKLTTKIDLIKEKINSDYIGEEIDENDLAEWAVKGYVAGLGDQYSEYYTPDEMEEYSSDTLGEYVGIGVYITLDSEKNAILVYDTIANSPARMVGLQKNDEIIEVDGVPCNGNDYDGITDKIKGKIGTKVKIKVKRTDENNISKEIEFEIERQNVELIRVTSQMLDNNIGYIYISSFDGTKVSDQFKSEYDKLVENGAKSLIIDVRSNGGGIVDEATEIGDLLTDKGKTLLIEKDKQGKETITTSKNDKKIKMNTILLINEFSASASEILAGICKEATDNVTLVGRTTYGKGVIQSLYRLSDGSGLKLTTEEYYTPERNEINNKGVTPDIEVESYQFNSEGELDKENDIQLQKAIEVLKNK